LHLAQLYSRSLPPDVLWEKTSKKGEGCGTYEPGGVGAGDSVIAAGDSTVPAAEASDAEGGVVVAAGGLVEAGVAAGSVVSVFCSHAARSAAPTRIQIYFFIGANLRGHIAVIGELEQGSFWASLNLLLTEMLDESELNWRLIF
jgi:hypothetical protein